MRSNLSPDTSEVALYNFCSELERSRKTSNDRLAIGTPGGGRALPLRPVEDKLIVLFQESIACVNMIEGGQILLTTALISGFFSHGHMWGRG